MDTIHEFSPINNSKSSKGIDINILNDTGDNEDKILFDVEMTEKDLKSSSLTPHLVDSNKMSKQSSTSRIVMKGRRSGTTSSLDS